VVETTTSRFPFLAAEPLPVRRSLGGGETSPLKTRVGGPRQWPSGRLSRRGRPRRRIATGSAWCAYQTASGRRKWPNRDPIEEEGGPNLYQFNVNEPISNIDSEGHSGSAVLRCLPIAGGCAVGDGPLPIGDVIAAGILVGAVAWDLCHPRANDNPPSKPDCTYVWKSPTLCIYRCRGPAGDYQGVIRRPRGKPCPLAVSHEDVKPFPPRTYPGFPGK
jgi:hypothetical protein